MSEDEEKERGFKVADRRRFSSEGELKADQAERTEEPPVVAPRPADKSAEPQHMVARAPVRRRKRQPHTRKPRLPMTEIAAHKKSLLRAS
jgi:hypothetical protein